MSGRHPGSKLDPHHSPAGRPSQIRSAEEHRRHRRLEIPARCWIIDVQGSYTAYLRLHDLSSGGISMRAPLLFRPAREVRLELELPSGTQVSASGQVVWVRTDGGEGPRLGARFIEFHSGESELYSLLDAALIE